jgi:hypothetical protein
MGPAAFLGLLFLLGVAAPAGAEGAPQLEEGVKIEAKDGPIEIPVGHLVPAVFDWDHDGKKDLILGQFKGGKIRLYRNAGSDEKPVFKDFEVLKAGGKEISVPAG